MKNTILSTLQTTMESMVTQYQEHGTALSFDTRIAAFATKTILRTITSKIIRDLKKQGHEITATVHVTIAQNQEMAAMEYNPVEHEIIVPFIGLLKLLDSYNNPMARNKLHDKLGRTVTDKEIIRELFAHELGHSKDTSLQANITEINELLASTNAFAMITEPTLEQAKEALDQSYRLQSLAIEAERQAFVLGTPFAQDEKLYNLLNHLNIVGYKNMYNRNITAIKTYINTIS